MFMGIFIIDLWFFVCDFILDIMRLMVNFIIFLDNINVLYFV